MPPPQSTVLSRITLIVKVDRVVLGLPLMARRRRGRRQVEQLRHARAVVEDEQLTIPARVEAELPQGGLPLRLVAELEHAHVRRDIRAGKPARSAVNHSVRRG